MRKPKHKRTGYNRWRAAMKRWTREHGKMFPKKLSRKTKEEILKNGWNESMRVPAIARMAPLIDIRLLLTGVQPLYRRPGYKRDTKRVWRQGLHLSMPERERFGYCK